MSSLYKLLVKPNILRKNERMFAHMFEIYGFVNALGTPANPRKCMKRNVLSSMLRFLPFFKASNFGNTKELQTMFQTDVAISKSQSTFRNTSKPQCASFLEFPILKLDPQILQFRQFSSWILHYVHAKIV